MTAANILHVREFGIDHLVVFRSHRHAPNAITRCLARLVELAGQFVVIGEEPCAVLAEGDQDGAGQGRQVDHEFRLVGLLAVPERIAKDEPTFRIGVDDLDRLTGHRGDNVTRTLSIAVRHVLDKADYADDIGLGLARGKCVHEASDGSGAAHVAFHVFHAAGRLDRDAARVEDDALADEGNRLVLGLAAIPLHYNEARRTDRTLGNAQQRTHAELLHFLLGQDLDLDAERRQGLGTRGKFHRAEDVGRLVDKIAGEHDAARHTLRRCPDLLAV